jgi:hypothetical protein
VPLVEQELLTLSENLSSPPVFSGVRVTLSLVLCVCLVDCCLSFCSFYAPETKNRGGHINLSPVRPFVRSSVRSSVRPSGNRYMVCPAISFYSFGATALIFCRMFIHIMEVFISTGFLFSSNIFKMTGSWTHRRSWHGPSPFF